MKRRNACWAVCLFVLATCGGCKKEEQRAEAMDLRPLVKVGKLLPSFTFTDGVQVQGSVRTKYSAAVSSRVSGALDAVMVDEGYLVKAGQPLFQVDKATLENRVRIAQDDLNVSKALLQEAAASLLEAEASYAKAEVDESRMKILY